MTCPYARVTGLLKKKVVCNLINAEVNYHKYPCIKGNYEECLIYKEKVLEVKSKKVKAAEAPEKIIAPRGEETQSREPLEKMVDEAVTKAKKFYDPKKGEKPPTCYDCLYFSPTTKMCLLLKRKIKNPERPECYQ